MKRSNIIRTLLLGLTLTAFAACGDDLEKADYDKALVQPTLPVVTTDAVEVYGTAAKATLTLTNPNDAAIQETGFVISSKENASLADSATTIVYVSDVELGTPKTVAINDLVVGTTYYVKAFASVEGGITYGDTKTITATDGYERVVDYSTDFSDMTGADIDDFTTVQLGSTVYPFTAVSLATLGVANQWGFSSSVFAPSLFSTGSAALASYNENNLLSYKADLTGKGFSQVSIEGLNIAALFGSSYPNYPGDFDVLISKEPITNETELAAATVLGTCKFSTDPTEDENFVNVITADIPIDYDGECYITIHSNSYYASSGANLGVVITGFALTSLHEVSK